MKRPVLFLIAFACIWCSCAKKEQVDLIVTAEGIYTLDSSFKIVEAIAIRNGLIVGTGSIRELKSRYRAAEERNFFDQFIFPGFIDAHCHFLGYGLDMDELDLKGCTSFEDMQMRVVNYAQQEPRNYIIGRGWNEEEWEAKTRPSNYKLNILFPDIPVVLQRVDGHAALANNKALEMAGIHAGTEISGGEVELMNGFPTGLLIDKAAEMVLDLLPPPDTRRICKALLHAQEKCLAKGLTCVSDAGLSMRAVQIIDSLQELGKLKIRIYAMANPDRNDLKSYEKTGPLIKDRLVMRSVKLYCDGSLGSRGAWLKKPYCDDSLHTGLPQQNRSYYEEWSKWGKEWGFQINTHCIGDSANAYILDIYREVLGGDLSLRWRIEHAQVVDPPDMRYFADYGVIPSVQPTHAISDMYMARKRLCTDDRLAGAYAYNDLLQKAGIIAFGTDFPVEAIDPLSTYYAAILREGRGREVFLPKQKMDAISALKAMTIWAAYANFMDQEIGSLSPGKKADLVVLNGDLPASRQEGVIQVQATMIQGEWLFGAAH